MINDCFVCRAPDSRHLFVDGVESGLRMCGRHVDAFQRHPTWARFAAALLEAGVPGIGRAQHAALDWRRELRVAEAPEGSGRRVSECDGSRAGCGR